MRGRSLALGAQVCAEGADVESQDADRESAIGSLARGCCLMRGGLRVQRLQAVGSGRWTHTVLCLLEEICYRPVQRSGCG